MKVVKLTKVFPYTDVLNWSVMGAEVWTLHKEASRKEMCIGLEKEIEFKEERGKLGDLTISAEIGLMDSEQVSFIRRMVKALRGSTPEEMTPTEREFVRLFDPQERQG